MGSDVDRLLARRAARRARVRQRQGHDRALRSKILTAAQLLEERRRHRGEIQALDQRRRHLDEPPPLRGTGWLDPPDRCEIDEHDALEPLGELVARERPVEVAREAQVRGAAVDHLVDPQLAVQIGDRVVELGREEAGDRGFELEPLLTDQVREERGAIVVEVHALVARRARALGELHRLDRLVVAIDLEQHAVLGVAVVAPERRVEAEHPPAPGEVGDHVELVDDLRRALDQDQRLHLLARGGHEVDPLADAERRDLLDPAEVDQEDVACRGQPELLALERLVDRADEPQARDAAVGKLLDHELRRGRIGGDSDFHQ